VTAIGGRPKPELCFLPGRLRWTLLPKERYGNSLSAVDRTPKHPTFQLGGGHLITELLPPHASYQAAEMAFLSSMSNPFFYRYFRYFRWFEFSSCL